MKTSELFPSKYWKAEDLDADERVTLTIDSVAIETMEISGDDKPVLHFTEGKPLVLNRTNCTTLEDAFGDDTEAWTGRRVEIFRSMTRFAGRRVPCLRLKAIGDGQPAKDMSLKCLDETNALLQEAGEDETGF